MTSRLCLLVAFAVLAGLPIGCSSSEPNSGDSKLDAGESVGSDGGSQNEELTVTLLVGAEGGTLSLEGASLVVPPGALAEATLLSLTRSKVPTPDGYDAFSSLYQLGPAEVRLAAPVTVGIHITKPGADAGIASMFRSRQGATGYERLETVVADGVASVQLDRLGAVFVADGVEYLDPADRSCARTRSLTRREVGGGTSALMLFFSAEDCQGRPLTGLRCDDHAAQPASCDLRLEEDGTRLPADTAAATLGRDGLQVFVSLVLDLSASSASYLPGLIEGAKSFANKLHSDEAPPVQLSVQVFGGEANLTEWRAPTLESKAVIQALSALGGFDPVEPEATNLHGALVEALRRQAQARSEFVARNHGGAFTAGYVVVFTDGADTAGRVTAAEVAAARATHPDKVLAVALRSEALNLPALQALVDAPVWTAPNPESLPRELGDLGRRLALEAAALYRLGYCSPARAGTHAVAVKVAGAGTDAGGSIASFGFSAEGFGPGCDLGLFTRLCEGKRCGGVACGACDDATATCDPATSRCVDNCKTHNLCGDASLLNDLGYVRWCGDSPESRSCGEVCRDTTSDAAHCGACGNACPILGSCRDGQCVCPEGRIACGGACIDPASDPANCGGCGTVCAAPTSACIQAVCSCPLPTVLCGEICEDAAHDSWNCGGCGVTCSDNHSCLFSACVSDPEWSRRPAREESPQGLVLHSLPGIVIDTVTGMQWEQSGSSTDLTWSEAEQYCANLPLDTGGFRWRLPRINELLEIVDSGRSAPAINTSLFPSTASTTFWSSTPGSGGTHWEVNFANGSSTATKSIFKSRVRCIR